jgi:hypothetical protein
MARYLDRIDICDFRGFPGPVAQKIELEGRHLLLYGENGSGKSSIFDAVRHLLDLAPNARPFNNNLTDPHCLKHRFSDPLLTVGHESLTFRAEARSGAVPDLMWTIGTDRPRDHLLFNSMARACGCLDYRALLRTHFLHETKDGVNLFELLVDDLLREMELPASTATLGDQWADILREGNAYLELSEKDPSLMDDLERQGYDLESALPPLAEYDEEPWESRWQE